MKNFLLLPLFLLSTLSAQSQIFGRIIDSAQDKLSQEISYRIVEAISDEITRVAMKPIDKAMDDMLRERYEQDSINGKTRARNYDDFLAAFTVPVDLPEKYTFDLTLEADTKDYDGQKSQVDMMLTEDGSAIGIVQYNEENVKSTIVFDMDKDIMVIYTDSKEEGKKVMAMPSMLSLAAVMVSNEEVDEEAYKVTIEKTGKTKKILGYQTDEWITDEEATTSKNYIASDFPISWKASFSKFLKEMMPSTRRDEMPDGMVLKTETKTKKKNKKSSFEVKKIIEDPLSIVNADYEKISYDAKKN